MTNVRSWKRSKNHLFRNSNAPNQKVLSSQLIKEKVTLNSHLRQFISRNASREVVHNVAPGESLPG